ncbi:acyltransferase family protein [Siminovitchia sediminis]|uniref:Acyltransferase family protein n=1 Tax=Siminovitchia sediminis TaxID=1274353 RepID=A0ABW4KIC9_9BACI
MIKEWNMLRVAACLTIVLLHSMTQTSRVLGQPQTEFYHFGRILMCFATPTFIVLSIIILANRYNDKLPKNFWESRIKYIYLPFISFGIIDALVGNYLKPNLLLDQKILDNVLTGKFIGWFILVIFQFYLLHFLVVRFKISVRKLFPFSVLIMGIYLYLINHDIITLGKYSYALKLPFIAWFGYFTSAFLVGKHYKTIAPKLYKYRWLTLVLLAASIGLVYLSYRLGNTAVDSRRFDLYPLVISMSAVILAWGQSLPNLKIVNLVSNYSFGIYLLHWQFQRLIAPHLPIFSSNYTYNVILLFLTSLVCSMLTIKIISFIPFGSFIIGKTKKLKKSKMKPQQVNVA